MTEQDTHPDGIEPCVGCDETVDALYCSLSCAQEDDGKVLESPLTGRLYYAAEWGEKDDGQYVAHEKQRIDWPENAEDDHDRR